MIKKIIFWVAAIFMFMGLFASCKTMRVGECSNSNDVCINDSGGQRRCYEDKARGCMMCVCEPMNRMNEQRIEQDQERGRSVDGLVR
jgi:hypothetical protein